MNITIFKAHSWQFYYSYKERWQLAQECLFMRSLFIYSKIVFSFKNNFAWGFDWIDPKAFCMQGKYPNHRATFTSNILLLLSNIYPTCKVQNYTGTSFFKSYNVLLIETCLCHYVINRKFSWNKMNKIQWRDFYTCSTSDYVPRKIECKSTYSSDALWQKHKMLFSW